MDKTYYNEPYFTEFDRSITSVSSYISNIKHIKSKLTNPENLFFRGQKTDFWEVAPSIFRNNYLNSEHMLMEKPLQKTPYEFLASRNDFEIMTKYQHYGMCTRLLDLTANPLVALYFACEEFGKVSYKYEDNSYKEKEPYGTIYFKKSDPISANDFRIKIISALAKMDLSKENNLLLILNKLLEENIITEQQKKKWLKKDSYMNFVSIIQKNYVVIPAYSNERLSRQNGLFLLTGSFNFILGDSIEESIIFKAQQDLKNEFESEVLYIEGENKKSILEELDSYNINEATLFPELEHQLNYIKEKNYINSNPLPDFISFEEDQIITKEKSKFSNIEKKIKNKTTIQNNMTNYLDTKFEEFLAKNIWDIIQEKIQIVDWYKKNSIISQLRITIKKLLIKNGYKITETESIIEELQLKLFEFANIN